MNGLRLLALLVALLAASCREAQPPPQDAPAPTRQRNLIGMHRGSAIASRTGEALLTTSVVRAIDGTAVTRWLAPPNAPEQSIVVALAARTRVTRVGFETGPKAANSTTSARAELSLDGTAFTPAGTFKLEGRPGPQTFPVGPTEASYLKITTLGGNGPFASLADIIADGEELEPAHSGPIGGCWSINGLPTSFVETGAAVTGVVGAPENAVLEGDFDGHFYRFAWVRGREYGLAAISVSRDGASLSGLRWHEQALMQDQFYADDWLGRRSDGEARCPTLEGGASVFRSYLQQQGYAPLYGLRFSAEGRLDESASSLVLDRVAQFLSANERLQVKVIAHELREPTKEGNLAVTRREIETLRDALARRGAPLKQVTFAAAGREHPRREADTPVTKALYSCVELEITK